MSMSTIIMMESAAADITIKMRSMNTIIMTESAAADITMKMRSMSIIIMTESAAADIIMTMKVIITQTKYLQAGELRRLTSMTGQSLMRY